MAAEAAKSSQTTSKALTMMEESRRRPPVAGFQCGERVDRQEDGSIDCVIFHCNLPQHNNANDGKDNITAAKSSRLVFCCREPSCGALLQEEEAADFNTEENYTVDPNFFDEGYTLAGRTGFQVWTGSRILMECLCWPESKDCARLQDLQARIANGFNILECGAGVGVVGTYLAAVGANVLLSDLPTLLEEAIHPNLERNQDTNRDATLNDNTCPEWLQPHGVRVGTGWADATSLDWKKPLDTQLSKTQLDAIDLIVASDCVFLVEMLDSLLDTVAAVFDKTTSSDFSFILSFQRRDSKDGDDSTSFTTVNRVLAEVKARNWTIECLAWRPETVGEDTNEVFVFEILP